MTDGMTPNRPIAPDKSTPADGGVIVDNANSTDFIIKPKSTTITINGALLSAIIENVSNEINTKFKERLENVKKGLNIKNNTALYISYLVTTGTLSYIFLEKIFPPDFIEMIFRSDFENLTLEMYQLIFLVIGVLFLGVFLNISVILSKNLKDKKHYEENDNNNFSLSEMILPKINENSQKLEESEKKINN